MTEHAEQPPGEPTPLTENEVTVKVNQLLKDLEDRVISVWSTIAHLGEWEATVKATHFLSKTVQEMRQVRGDNYEAMSQRRGKS
jgi:hypothetical protein